jgi:oxygen-independent coproporphyrinogen III oxidase
MTVNLIEKYAGNVPRYTSYPTAPHFHEGIGNVDYAGWLSALKDGDTLSLYFHIPYCDRLCWFCACHTKQTHKYEPVKSYLQALSLEIRTVGALVTRGAKVTAIHFGGGSPTLVAGEDMVALMALIRETFTIADDAEISVEMDPNDLDDGRYDGLAAIGMTRASLGVQDFAPKVQHAINRIQTFAQTAEVVAQVRKRGVKSVNCDIVYGLPFQTLESLESTVRDIISIDPDRVALFGYAHVPWMKKHQTMISDESLPGADMRFVLMNRAADMLKQAGYVALGIDHFAKPEDSLAIAAREGRLARNFQGYTDDQATALIGLGASSIGRLPQGYVQNIPATGMYQKTVEQGRLAVARGIELSADDLMRAWVIERIMCDYTLSFDELGKRFGSLAAQVIAEAQDLVAGDPDRHVEIIDGCLTIAPEAWPFARSIACRFDAYLANGRGRHSIAV